MGHHWKICRRAYSLACRLPYRLGVVRPHPPRLLFRHHPPDKYRGFVSNVCCSLPRRTLSGAGVTQALHPPPKPHLFLLPQPEPQIGWFPRPLLAQAVTPPTSPWGLE